MKKHSNSIFLLTLCLIVIQYQGVFGQTVPEYRIKASQILNGNDEAIGFYNPSRIVAIGEYLIIIDDANDDQVLVFDIKSHKFINAIGKIGRGPGEFLDPWNIFISKTESQEKFCIYGLRLRKISCFDLENVVKKSSHLPLYSVMLGKEIGMPLRINGMPTAKEFIITGIFPESYRFLLADSSGNVTRRSDKVDHQKEKEPLNVFQHAYTVVPVSNLEGTKIALGYFYSNLIEIYSSGDGTMLTSIRGIGDHDFYKPLFSTRKTPYGLTMAQGGDTRLAYIDINAGENYIYALYSGRRRKDKGSGQSNIVHVVSWDGELKSVLHLDTDVRDCDVSSLNGRKKLFCINNSRVNPSILTYEIADLKDN